MEERQNINRMSKMEYPADLLKFTAYKKPVENYDKALEIILNKQLVLGEPAVVPFWYEHTSEPVDPSTGEPVKSVELLFAIGSLDINKPYVNCSVNIGILNDCVVVRKDGTSVTMSEIEERNHWQTFSFPIKK